MFEGDGEREREREREKERRGREWVALKDPHTRDSFVAFAEENIHNSSSSSSSSSSLSLAQVKGVVKFLCAVADVAGDDVGEHSHKQCRKISEVSLSHTHTLTHTHTQSLSLSLLYTHT